jgi:uncharacterized protein (DUF3084 family)
MLRAEPTMPEDPANETNPPLVLRVEISTEQVESLAPRLRHVLAPAGDDGAAARRAEGIAEREARLADEQAALQQRARQLAEREAELGSSDELTASDRIRLAQRRRHLDESEQDLALRENDLVQREAEFEADVMFREERIERWRSELSTLEEELARRERDLASYVDQLQGAVVDGRSLPAGPRVTELRRSA